MDHRACTALLAAGVLLMAAITTASAQTAAAAEPDAAAVVLMYHRFGEDAYPSTNIRLEQFEAHIAELKSGKYNVLPLPEIVAALTVGGPLPDRAVAITVDDAYRSVFTEAWPRLKAAGLPFTVFVATDPVERRQDGYMTWTQVRALRAAGVTIAAHSHTHAHLARLSGADAGAELAWSNRILQRELGRAPEIFAYPYGEASAATAALARENGYIVGFGQHSGVAFHGLDRYYLPRFALNEAYGAMDRFRLVVNALPLLARDITPVDPMVRPEVNPPAFGFTTTEGMGNLERLACFHSRSGDAHVERLGERRIEVRFNKALPAGRSRVNCTMPAGGGRWRWLGTQFYVKPKS